MRFANFRNFLFEETQKHSATRVEVLLLDASGSLVAAPQFFRNFQAIFAIFSHLDWGLCEETDSGSGARRRGLAAVAEDVEH